MPAPVASPSMVWEHTPQFSVMPYLPSSSMIRSRDCITLLTLDENQPITQKIERVARTF